MRDSRDKPCRLPGTKKISMVFTWNKKTRFGPGWRLTGKEIPAHVVNIADIAGYLAPFDESNAALPRGDKSSFLKKMAFTRFKKKPSTCQLVYFSHSLSL